MTDTQITLDTHAIQALLSGDPDALRILAQNVLQKTLEAQMDDHLGAQRYERSEQRTGSRNGHYERQLTTRVGQLTLRVPRDREGTFTTALFERYSRSERALVATLVEMVVCGVSTRRVTKITQELCGKEFSKSTVSRYAQELDELVGAWRNRRLNHDFPFLLVDAIHLKVRQDTCVESMALMIAVGVGEDGVRRILGCELGHSECMQGGLGFFRNLVERGLSGVDLVVSDAHEGLVQAARKVFAGAVWQRCQTHFRRNVSDAAPRRHQNAIHAALDVILKAENVEEARAALEQTLEELDGKCDKALECLERGWEDACAVLNWPAKYRKRLRTTNMVERLNGELRRRDRVIRIYPNPASAIRLMGAQLVEHDESWATNGKYLDMLEYQEWKASREASETIHAAAAE